VAASAVGRGAVVTRRSMVRAVLAFVGRGWRVLVGFVDGVRVRRGVAGLSSCRCEQTRREDSALRREILAGYERLRKDPVAWASYLAEPHEGIVR
jgi:hypothetical protein